MNAWQLLVGAGIGLLVGCTVGLIALLYYIRRMWQ